MRWSHWYFEYEVTLWNYSEADAMGILNIHSDIGIFNIHSKLRRFLNIHSNDVTSEYSKYQCHMNIQNTHDASFEYSHDGT